jgi:hypothetical protein
MLERAERQAKVVELRKRRLPLRAIAAEVGCSHVTVRHDINRYISDLDRISLDNAAAIRAELAETYDELIKTLEVEVLENGNLRRSKDLIAATEALRKLYALDVQPLGRSELQLRRAVITEMVNKLQDSLEPEVFAQVTTTLLADEPIKLLDSVATDDGTEAALQPPGSIRQG